MCEKARKTLGRNPGAHAYKMLQKEEAAIVLEIAKKQNKPAKFLKKQTA